MSVEVDADRASRAPTARDTLDGSSPSTSMVVGSHAFGSEFEPLEAVVGGEALGAALQAKSDLGGSLALNLVRIGAIDENAFFRTHLLSGFWREADPALVNACDASMLRYVPPEIVSGFGMIPLQIDAAGSLVVGVAEPVQRPRIDEAEFFAGMTVVPRIVTWSAFQHAFQRVTGRPLCDLPQHPVVDGASATAACLQHVTTLEEAANEWVRTRRDAPEPPPEVAPAAAERPQERPQAPVVVPPESSRPTPIEPVEAVSGSGSGSRLSMDEGSRRDAGTRVLPAASELVDDGTSGRGPRAAAVRAAGGADGIYGPAPAVVDRMGHPSPFVRAVVRNLLRAFQGVSTTDQLMLELVEGLGLVYPNALILSVRAGQLHVWQASLYRGPRETVSRRFDYETLEPWDRVISEGLAFRGRLSPRDPVRELMGRDLSRDTLLFPIAIRGRAVAVVVLDAGYEAELTPAGGQYEALESGINDALVQILRTRRMVGDVA